MLWQSAAGTIRLSVEQSTHRVRIFIAWKSLTATTGPVAYAECQLTDSYATPHGGVLRWTTSYHFPEVAATREKMCRQAIDAATNSRVMHLTGP